MMKLFPYKRVRVSQDSHIWVSCYPMKQPYDLPSLPDRRFGLTEFVPVRYPGCGFFQRTTNSRTYQLSVQACRQAFVPTYRNWLTSRLPSLSKLASQGEKAFSAATDPLYRDLFESYVNMLILAQEEDRMCRVMAALRKRMRGRHGTSYSAHLKDSKRTMRGIEKRRALVTFDMTRYYSPEVMEAYGRMVEEFSTFSRIHHIWDMRLQHDGNERCRVFFDMGALNCVYTPVPIPLMRNMEGQMFYLLPDRVVRFRDPFHFDTWMLKDISIRYGALGDGAQSELMLPELDLIFRFSSVRRVQQFAESWKALQDMVK